ncbi:hypothetical protein Q7A53_09095 [Halobacillus rhizosphaerae]
MSQKKGNAMFPGQKQGTIRVLIKKGQKEGSVQLSFDLFEEELSKKD